MQFASVGRKLYRGVRGTVLQSIIPRSRTRTDINLEGLVEVIGFLRSDSGIGESARLCVDELRGEMPNIVCTTVEKVFGKQEKVSFLTSIFDHRAVTVRIFHLNPPMMPPVVIRKYFGDFARTFNIGYWAWELQDLPPEWRRACRYLDAILCPSEFTRNAVQHYFSGPVRTVHHPVPIKERRKPAFYEANPIFTVSTIVNLTSGLQRKNPIAAIAAFKRSLGGNKRAKMIVKLDDSSLYPEIEAEASNTANIEIVRATWTRAKINDLLQSSNLYISLHRSEGFGLTIAEAMAAGAPPVVTAWSGNMDFCNPANAFLVPYKLVPVDSRRLGSSRLPEAVWAEPDVAEAARVIGEAFDNPEDLRNRSRMCIEFMENWSRGGYLKALHSLMATNTTSSDA